MTTIAPNLEPLVKLSGFDGQPDAAFRTLAQHLMNKWPGVGVALVLTDDLPAGQCRLVALVGADGHELLAATDPYGETTRLPFFDDALAVRLFARVQAQRIEVNADERHLPLAQALISPVAIMALPMPREGKIEHWMLVTSAVPFRFEDVNLERALYDVALAYSLIAGQVMRRTLESEVARQHREIAGLADIQRLLQPEQPRIRGFNYAVHWQPAETAAGDYYDLMSLTPLISDFVDHGADAWGAMLADVSGHGAAAAMESVQFDAILRTYKGDEPPNGPAGALTYANRHFFSRRQRSHFMTIFAVACRPDRNTLQYVCAGHLPALHRRAAGTRWLGRDNDAGIPLGVLRDHRWENVETPFMPGDMLVLYTDGITEARDRRGEQFGLDRLYDAAAMAEPTAQETLDAIKEAVFEHQGGAVGEDDQTVIVLKRED